MREYRPSSPAARVLLLTSFISSCVSVLVPLLQALFLSGAWISSSHLRLETSPPPAPTTHHIAALTICPPLHGVEMLAPELGPARRTHKAANVKDAVQGHDPGPIPDHIFSAATTPAWGRAGTGSICTGWEVGSTGLLTLQPHLPFPAPPGVSSPTEVLPAGWVVHVVHQLLGQPLKLLLGRLAQGDLGGENQGLGPTSTSTSSS